MRNNWVCYDFKERRIVPTHYAARKNDSHPDCSHLKSTLAETSADGESWRKVAHEEDNEHLNYRCVIGTFAVAGGGDSPFIRLVNIGRNHCRIDDVVIDVEEIFGSLFESPPDSSDVAFASRRRGAGAPPSASRSPGHTWTPSPPPGSVGLGETMGTHANPMLPSCRGRLQLSSFRFRLVPVA
jgi:hypothetical protein